MKIHGTLPWLLWFSFMLCAAGAACSIALTYCGFALFVIAVIIRYSAEKRKPVLNVSGLELPLIAWLAGYVVSSALGVSPGHSFSNISAEFIVLVFFICRIGASRTMGRSFLSVFAVTTAVAAMFGILQYILGIDLDMQGNVLNVPSWLRQVPVSVLNLLALKQGRIVSTRSHPITYAEGAVFGLIFIIAFMIIEKKKTKRILWAAAGIVTLIAIIFSYTRGAWLALAAAIPVFLIVQKRKIIRFRCVLLIAVITGCGMLAHPHLRQRILSIDRGSRDTNTVRIVLWKTGLDIVKDHPFFGIGPSTTKLVYKTYQHPEIPDKRMWSEFHNQYLQVAVERGIIGLGIYLWLLVTVFFVLFRTWSVHSGEVDGQLAASGIACFVAFLAMGLTENAYYDSEISLILWFMLGCMSVISKAENLDDAAAQGCLP